MLNSDNIILPNELSFDVNDVYETSNDLIASGGYKIDELAVNDKNKLFKIYAECIIEIVTFEIYQLKDKLPNLKDGKISTQEEFDQIVQNWDEEYAESIGLTLADIYFNAIFDAALSTFNDG